MHCNWTRQDQKRQWEEAGLYDSCGGFHSRKYLIFRWGEREVNSLQSNPLGCIYVIVCRVVFWQKKKKIRSWFILFADDCCVSLPSTSQCSKLPQS